jgi:hypothetical protein
MKTIPDTPGPALSAATPKALSRAGYLPVTFDNLEHGHERVVKWGPLERGDLRNQDDLKRALRNTSARGGDALCRAEVALRPKREPLIRQMNFEFGVAGLATL